MSYEEKRAEFLNTLHAGDLISWTTFDGSSIHEVTEVTDTEIVIGKSRWPRSGTVHREYYGGFDEKLGPPGPQQVEYFLRNRHRHSIEAALKDMDAETLKKVDEFASGLAW